MLSKRDPISLTAVIVPPKGDTVYWPGRSSPLTSEKFTHGREFSELRFTILAKDKLWHPACSILNHSALWYTRAMIVRCQPMDWFDILGEKTKALGLDHKFCGPKCSIFLIYGQKVEIKQWCKKPTLTCELLKGQGFK